MWHYFGNRWRRFVAFAFDAIAVGAAFIGALFLRFDFVPPPETVQLVLDTLPLIYAAQVLALVAHRLYRGIWAFASVRDLFAILRAVTVAVLAAVAVAAMTSDRLLGWPRSIFIIDGVLLLLILGGGRFGYRYFREIARNLRRKQKRVLVIGAGDTANLIAREILAHPERGSRIVGFLDDRPKRIGMQIQGAPVLGNLDLLAQVIDRRRIDEVIIGIPSLPGDKVRKIVNTTRGRNIPCRISPPVRDALTGNFHLGQLREIRVEDLLRRDVVSVDDPGLISLISGQTILVTGAGGSIGSELCRQILKYHPGTLLLLERSEYHLYQVEREFRQLPDAITHGVQLQFLIGDILDRRRIADILEKFQPKYVFHAAAYKHVPIMEANVSEAIQNNVIGTEVLAEEAARSGVEKFVLISTDKAVRPSSVMGATKRMAEMVCNAVGSETQMRTLAVRFGNVLDSQGSVLPLFKEQISRGGPVTVTHPEMRRYFMTIPEAALLVLQAAFMGKGGEVFLLDMGEPVLIRELAEELILLSGYQPHKDIQIAYTGLRPGEKLYEELLGDINHAEKTAHSKIVVSARELRGVLSADWKAELEVFSEREDIPVDGELLRWIQRWVPEFRSERLTAQAHSEGREELTGSSPSSGRQSIH